MTEELKPCPFCGKVPSGIDEFDSKSFGKQFQIQCENDTCSLEVTVLALYSKEAAIAAWNTRAPVASNAGGVLSPIEFGELKEALNLTTTETDLYQDTIIWKAARAYLATEQKAHICDDECGGSVNVRHCGKAQHDPEDYEIINGYLKQILENCNRAIKGKIGDFQELQDEIKPLVECIRRELKEIYSTERNRG